MAKNPSRKKLEPFGMTNESSDEEMNEICYGIGLVGRGGGNR